MSREEDTQRAKDQARAQFESIKGMVEAIQCDYERMEELKEQLEGLTSLEDAETANRQEDYKELEELVNSAGDCENEDDARGRIQEDPLSVEVRSEWHSPGAQDNGGISEFRILLCWGGPAVQIIGELDDYNQPCEAKLQFQDWGIGWADHFPEDEDADEILLEYCQQFYFGD